MLIKNLDDSLVNGSMGTITEFCLPQDFVLNPVDTYEEGGSGSGSGSKPSSKVGKPSSKVGNAGDAQIGQKLPVVEFVVRQGSHTMKRRMLMMPEMWKVELPNGELQVSRTQVSRVSGVTRDIC